MSSAFTLGLTIVNWLIGKKILKEKHRRAYISMIESKSESNYESKNLTKSYLDQVEELKQKRESRNILEKSVDKEISHITGKLAVIVGHKQTSPGAMGIMPLNMAEYDWANGLASEIEALGLSNGHEVRIFLRNKISIEKVYSNVKEWRPHAIMELHFNAYNGKVRGTEVLYSDIKDHSGIREKILAKLTCMEISAVLGRKGKENRGIKNRAKGDGERGFVNVSQVIDVPSILTESIFGDNKEDATLGDEKLTEIAWAHITAFEKWLA